MAVTVTTVVVGGDAVRNYILSGDVLSYNSGSGIQTTLEAHHVSFGGVTSSSTWCLVPNIYIYIYITSSELCMYSQDCASLFLGQRSLKEPCFFCLFCLWAGVRFSAPFSLSEILFPSSFTKWAATNSGEVDRHWKDSYEVQWAFSGIITVNKHFSVNRFT